MGAGLERDVERRAARPLPRLLERHHLGVANRLELVPALAHDLAVADDYRSDEWMVTDPPASALRKLQRALEPGHDAASASNR